MFVEIWKHASTASTGGVGTGAADAGRERTFGFGHGGEARQVVVGGRDGGGAGWLVVVVVVLGKLLSGGIYGEAIQR